MRKFKVLKPYTPTFPYGTNAIIHIPKGLKKFEWVHRDGVHSENIDTLIESGILEEIHNVPEPTLKSVTKDYDNYGYLEDYQVKWLLSAVHDYRALLETLKFKIITTPDFWDIKKAMKNAEHTLNPIEIKFTHDDIITLIEELKTIQ